MNRKTLSNRSELEDARVTNKLNGKWKLAICALLFSSPFVWAEDWLMWGRTPDRVMISPEKNPPMAWEIKGVGDATADKNIKWSAELGSQSYGNPVVVGGLVIVGTNNEGKRDPKYILDGGVLAIFRESDGK